MTKFTYKHYEGDTITVYASNEQAANRKLEDEVQQPQEWELITDTSNLNVGEAPYAKFPKLPDYEDSYEAHVNTGL